MLYGEGERTMIGRVGSRWLRTVVPLAAGIAAGLATALAWSGPAGQGEHGVLDAPTLAAPPRDEPLQGAGPGAIPAPVGGEPRLRRRAAFNARIDDYQRRPVDRSLADAA